MTSDLIRGWLAVRVEKTRQGNKLLRQSAQWQYETPSSTGQRALRGSLGFSIGTTPLPLPTNTPCPTTTDDLLPMMTLGCGEARLDRVPSAQMMASPAKMPRLPSSQLTSTPCLVQDCAIAGPAKPATSAEIRMENESARVMIMPSSARGLPMVVGDNPIPVQGLAQRPHPGERLRQIYE